MKTCFVIRILDFYRGYGETQAEEGGKQKPTTPISKGNLRYRLTTNTHGLEGRETGLLLETAIKDPVRNLCFLFKAKITNLPSSGCRILISISIGVFASISEH